MISPQTLYEYTAQYNDELSFTAGVILSLEKDIDSNWIQCRLGQRTGLVPLSYITVIQPLPNQQHRSSLEESVSHVTCHLMSCDISPDVMSYVT